MNPNKFCTNCGKEIPVLAKFCTHCGKDLKQSSPQFHSPVSTCQITRDRQFLIFVLGVSICGLMSEIIGVYLFRKATKIIFPQSILPGLPILGLAVGLGIGGGIRYFFHNFNFIKITVFTIGSISGWMIAYILGTAFFPFSNLVLPFIICGFVGSLGFSVSLKTLYPKTGLKNSGWISLGGVVGGLLFGLTFRISEVMAFALYGLSIALSISLSMYKVFNEEKNELFGRSSM